MMRRRGGTSGNSEVFSPIIVEVFESEKDNREQRRKKREQRQKES